MKVHAIVGNLEQARHAADAGATVIQLRVKAPTDEVVARGQGFRDLGMMFVVNDDVDAALELRADGVHLGQSDPGADRARAAGLVVGRSASTLVQAQAVEEEADYIGVGPVWASPSKVDGDPAIGLEALRAICISVVGVPIVAIGGIDSTNAGACIRAGAEGVAAIRAATDPELRRAVDEALAGR